MRSTAFGRKRRDLARVVGIAILISTSLVALRAIPSARADEVRRPLPKSLQATLALAISPDDELLAGNRGARLQIYDLRGPRLVAELSDPKLAAVEGHGVADVDVVRSLAFDKSGQWLASGGLRTVRLWRRPSATSVRQLDLGKAIRAVAVRADDAQIAIGLESGIVELRAVAADSNPLILTGHAGPVTALCFTSAGLLTSSTDKTLRLWKIDEGKLLGSWARPHESHALTRVGDDQVASGEADGTIRLWSAASITGAIGVEMFPPPAIELKGHSQPVTSLAAVATIKDRLISGSDDGRVRIWNLTNGQPVRDLGQESPVATVALRGDGKRLVSVGPKSVRLWNADDGSLVAEIKSDWRIVRDVVRADGALNYGKASVEYRKRDLREAEEALKRETGVAEGAVKAKDMAEKTLAEKTAAAMKATQAKVEAEQKANERMVALKSSTDARDAAKSAVEVANAAVKQAQTDSDTAKSAADKDKENKDLAAAVAKTGDALIAAKAVKQAADVALTQATDARNAAEKAQQEATRMSNEAKNKAQGPEREAKEAQNALLGATNFIVTANAVLERTKQAVPAAQRAVALAESLVAQCDSSKQAVALKVTSTASPFRTATFVGGGRFVALAGLGGLVTLVDAETGTTVETLPEQPGKIDIVAAVGENQFVLGTFAGRISLWSSPAASWTLARTIGNERAPDQLVDRVLSVDFSPDGKLLATAGGVAADEGELKLWNVADGTLVRRFESPHEDTIQCVRFSPDGQFLATAAADRLVKIFRVGDGQLHQTFAGHSQHVLGVGWAKDGKSLASCGADQVIKIWNLESGGAARTLRGDTYRVGEYRRAVTSLMFVGDTEHFVASAGDRTVRLHRAGSTSDVRSFLNGASYYHAAVATSDGKWVVAGGQDGVIHFWHGESGYRQFAFEPDQPGVVLKAK